MIPTEETYKDKSAWGHGPWQDEPDRVEWRSETKGWPCLIVRNNSGSLCGYVGVPPGHPLHGKGYSEEVPELKAALEKRMNEPMPEQPGMGLMVSMLSGGVEPRMDCALNVHGGITFAGHCQEGGKICHVAQPGEPEDVWWIGFDCAHAGDLMPAHEHLMASHGLSFGRFGEVYRTVDYVKAEVEQLALQLACL